MEISGNLSETTRVLTNGWARRGNSEPLESTVGERELVKYVQGPAGPDGPVSQPLESTQGERELVKHVQGPAGPDGPVSQPLESTVGERELVKYVQGPAGPDGPVSQAQEQSKTKQLEKRVQKSSEPRRTARTFRVYLRNYFLINAVNRYHAIFSRHV